MRYLKSVGLAVTTLCLCLSPLVLVAYSPAIAQPTITQKPKTEGESPKKLADRLLQQGIQQYQTSQYEAG